MINIDEIIINNKNLFDYKEPDYGHFERFKDKLNLSQKRSIRFSIINVLKVAAVAVLIIISSIWVTENFIIDKKEISLGDVSPEYNDVEFYYISLVNSKLTEINKYNNNLKEELLNKELIEIDSLYTNLQKELKANYDDERIINAMIFHYQAKVEILTQVLKNLNNVKHIKNKDNESTKI